MTENADEHWRVVWTPLAPAALNMAIDEAIAESVESHRSPPTLRIYGWQPPAVSLGYAQALDANVNLQAVLDRGYDLVRRSTGGRAVIHNHEVTYSVAVPPARLACGASVVASYREISRGVELGLTLLGLRACIPHLPDARRASTRSLPTICFAKTIGGDMVVDGRKIVGSAQLRRPGVILQHGSVPIHIDPAEHVDILGSSDATAAAQRRIVARAAVGVADALGRPVSFQELGEAIIAGFRQALGVDLIQRELSDHEAARAQELVTVKYGTDAWTSTPGRRS